MVPFSRSSISDDDDHNYFKDLEPISIATLRIPFMRLVEATSRETGSTSDMDKKMREFIEHKRPPKHTPFHQCEGSEDEECPPRTTHDETTGMTYIETKGKSYVYTPAYYTENHRNLPNYGQRLVRPHAHGEDHMLNHSA
jgi:hypothetical protein